MGTGNVCTITKKVLKQGRIYIYRVFDKITPKKRSRKKKTQKYRATKKTNKYRATLVAKIPRVKLSCGHFYTCPRACVPHTQPQFAGGNRNLLVICGFPITTVFQDDTPLQIAWNAGTCAVKRRPQPGETLGILVTSADRYLLGGFCAIISFGFFFAR